MCSFMSGYSVITSQEVLQWNFPERTKGKRGQKGTKQRLVYFIC